ncbi:MAG: septation protein SepH [Agromyces sp.]
MQELKVIGIEDGALIAVSDEGDRFRVAIDAVMQTKIRQLQSQRTASTRVSPREIQSFIRAGMTREQVAAATGASVEDVERYEGPVLAEREHMLANALSAPVHVAGDDTLSHTFGTVIRERLAGLGASEERWACWKDELQGWLVKIEFTADTIDHDARWAYDHRSQALQPLNSEAITLSQHGEIRGGLIPKLRAVDGSSGALDQSRFDSAAFVLDDHRETGPQFEVIPPQPEQSLPTATAAATNREEEPTHSPNDTADLLEALRKRRGERQASPEFDMFADVEDGLDTVVLDRDAFETGSHDDVFEPSADPQPVWGSSSDHGTATGDELASVTDIDGASKRKNGRTALPSWDEIVFGSRGDDDNSPA